MVIFNADMISVMNNCLTSVELTNKVYNKKLSVFIPIDDAN